MPLFRRFLGYSIVSVGVGSLSTYVAAWWSPQFNRRLSSNGVVRFGRAAVAVSTLKDI